MVIIIIAIVSTIGANNFKTQRQYVKYNDSILKVMGMIQTARNYAVTSRAAWDPVNQVSIVPTFGYGVYINRSDSRFVLFANTAATSTTSSLQFDEGQITNDIIEEEYFLPLDTDFSGLLIDKTPTDLASVSANPEDEAVIIFTPPLASAFVAANDYPLSANDITEIDDLYLEFRRLGTTMSIPSKYIHINKVAGFPEVE